MDNNAINILARKAGFNAALRHFRTITAYAQQIQDGANLADLIAEDLEEGAVEGYQVRPALNALLVDKFGYAYRSHNLDETIETADDIARSLSAWTNIQIVFVYHHPQAGVYVLNPKMIGTWEAVLPLMKDELLVAYVGAADLEASDEVLAAALADTLKVLYGQKVRAKKAYIAPEGASSVAVPEAEPIEQAPQAKRPGKRRMTPRYSVLVTNELFHNGNVEAWKRIIDSYKAKFGGLDVLIWYENERINDINALFKWGKVKHGTPILVSVVGDDIKGVSKLQRYLYEGASPRFEVFLKGGVDRILDLF